MSQSPFGRPSGDRPGPSPGAGSSGSAWQQPPGAPTGDPFADRSGSGAPPPNTNPVNVPNALTVLRLIMVPVFGWMLLAHPYDLGWRILATLVFGLAMVTDAVDGHLARKYNIVTSFGKIADPIADKAITGMAFVGLSIIGELLGEHPVTAAEDSIGMSLIVGPAWAITGLILLREWGITLMRFLVLRTGVVLAADRGGKIKTVVQTVALVLSLLPLIQPFKWLAWVAVIAALVLTVVTGVRYAIGMITALQNRAPAAAPASASRPPFG